MLLKPDGSPGTVPKRCSLRKAPVNPSRGGSPREVGSLRTCVVSGIRSDMFLRAAPRKLWGPRRRRRIITGGRWFGWGWNRGIQSLGERVHPGDALGRADGKNELIQGHVDQLDKADSLRYLLRRDQPVFLDLRRLDGTSRRRRVIHRRASDLAPPFSRTARKGSGGTVTSCGGKNVQQSQSQDRYLF